ncbi:hypothetical protein [Chondromyces crocatus]|uniref:Uncharacterized protein n=1 Tax=Chondromyces crocatus TaxID=52 RepID=A0A0K1EP82_CHOCO|nr:hypothetical protein [Chondromyces crocatus]AKT42656.1 uncharacterized protein CMC5_068830 [Chondromyces crocatus]
MPSLFEQVVDCCDLAPAFAQRIISQALRRSGIDPATMRPEDLIRALPAIRQELSVFLDPQEVHRKIAGMRALVRGSWPAFTAVGDPLAHPLGESPGAKTGSNGR